MPTWFYLVWAVFMILIVDPACPKREFLLEVLIELVAISVLGNESARFGVANVEELMEVVSDTNLAKIPQRSHDRGHGGRANK